MIKKVNWTSLIETTETKNVLSADVSSMASAIDTFYESTLGVKSRISLLITYLNSSYLSVVEDNNPWGDLPVYISSYSENDKRFRYELEDRLLKYLAFFKKVLTDDGLATRMTINKTFGSATSSTTGSKHVESETPQIELDNFEAGIKYASSLSKDDNTGSERTDGGSDDTHKKVTWDEEMKNLRLFFYNELIDYIANIPDLIYNHYCLDSRPWYEIVRESCNYIKSAFEIIG